MAFDSLIKKISEKKNPTVAGLDPKLDYIPDFIKERCFARFGKSLEGACEAIRIFNFELIDELADIVPAIKPQSAYYEMYGYHGEKVLDETIQYAKSKGLYVIVDGKRNDIGATMTAYSVAYLGKTDIAGVKIPAFGADSLTVNGYLGTDGIKPLVDIVKGTNKGIFVLAKTSNKSSGELQDRTIDGKPIYLIMGEACEKWGAETVGEFGYSAVGAVVGATYPKQLEELRKKLPHTFFLVPGYGAQGGGGKGVAGAFDERGFGAIVNSSRGIMCAYKKIENADPKDFAKYSREEAIRMKEDITQYINLQ